MEESPVVDVTSTETGLPMLGWCVEKTANLATSLGQVAEELLRSQPSLTGEEAVFEHLYAAARETIKLLALFTGHLSGELPNSNVIVQGGVEAVASLLTAWAKAPAVHAPWERLERFFARARELMNEGRTARTLMHELVREYSSSQTEPFATLLERVTEGEMSWEVFVSEATELLSKLEEDLRWVELSEGVTQPEGVAHILSEGHPPDTLCRRFQSTGRAPRPRSFWWLAPEQLPRCKQCRASATDP